MAEPAFGERSSLRDHMRADGASMHFDWNEIVEQVAEQGPLVALIDWMLFEDDGQRFAVELVGFLAAGTTVTAFYCRAMLPLRFAAIVANLLFIVYGAMLDLKPVLALHCVLLPLNLVRLSTALRERADAPEADVERAGER